MPPRPRCTLCERNRQSTRLRTPFVPNDRFTEYLPESAPITRHPLTVCDDCYATWRHRIVVALRPILAERRRQEEQAQQAPRLQVQEAQAPLLSPTPRIIRRATTTTVTNTVTITNNVIDDEDPKVITIVETKVRVVSNDPTDYDADPENI